MSAYRGRVAALLTRHGKEAAVAPPLRERLGVGVVRVDGFDTDALGTFTGEVPRAGSQREAARRKAEIASEEGGTPLGLGSEGAFGPDPTGLVAWNVELVVLVDRELGLEVVGRAHGPTRHARAEIDTVRALEAFARAAGFPEHGLVLRTPGGPIEKGLRDPDELRAAFERLRGGAVIAEHDLRAHQHPTRMARIAEAASDLADRLARSCPACGSPGFGPEREIPGAPCRWCGLPTPRARADRWACVACPHGEERERTGQADPAECIACNP